MDAERGSTSTRVRASCQCNDNCNTKRFRCFEEDLRCSVHCHKDEHECENLSNLVDRTEVGLLEKAHGDKRMRTNTIGDSFTVNPLGQPSQARGQSCLRPSRDWVGRDTTGPLARMGRNTFHFTQLRQDQRDISLLISSKRLCQANVGCQSSLPDQHQESYG